jgi:peroxiredoxin
MTHKLNPRQIAAVAVLVLFTVFITWRAKRLEENLLDRNPASELVGKAAPEFALPAMDGRNVSLQDYRGKKKLVISYWASWCGPCQIELPLLRDFYRKYHKEDSDFEVLAVSVDEDRYAAASYARKENLPFPVLLDPNSKTADAYSVDGIPAMFVVNKSGKIMSAKVGLDQAMEVRLASELGIEMKFGNVELQREGDKQ